MAIITLETSINAPAERCFLLSLSVDLHMNSTSHTQEKAVAGITRGIMKLNDTVTWRAKHFGVVQELTTVISAYEKPGMFVDEMVKGAFKKIYHVHRFEEKNDFTLMKDSFEYQAPLGILGTAAEKLFLTSYMTKFLVKRNEFIKQIAEGDEWGRFI